MSYGGLTFVNRDLVNYDNSQWSAGFTSKAIPTNGLPEPSNNVIAISSSKILGGKIGKKIGKKIKNTHRIYKRMGKHTIKSAINSNILTKKRLSKKRLSKKRLSKKRLSKKRLSKKRLSKKRLSKKRLSKKRLSKKNIYGGYSQYQNNVPLTPTYSTAGLQNNNFMSALANPVPYDVLSNCTNCVDNYNHYTNTGFPSRGSY
jgi:hypothetical protein